MAILANTTSLPPLLLSLFQQTLPSGYFNTSCATPDLFQCLVFNTYADHASRRFDIFNAILRKALSSVALTVPALTTH
ncbi:hypothetical protein NP233_g7275 [Leucocoprinus birnbaumii]|uniref:Uncharacterized protein n=1 Tax=Leucocoprinus birnbaumii TaxID=56174 RepID=A0AAD5VSU0_9AGAR|nr:hypothetical protein NP233_g7275 [Leucocoprinus birnbaumii]